MTEISDAYNEVNTSCIIATNGISGGNGTVAAPISWALAKQLQEEFWPGVSLVLLEGIYTIDDTVLFSGNPNALVTVQGSGTINGSVFLSGDHSAIRDLTIYDADFLDRVNNIPLRDGFRFQNHYCKAINVIVHDCRQGALSGYTDAHDAEINGCVVYFNGWVGVDRGHGHGLYVSNSSGSFTLKNCIVFNNFGYGIHAWAESVVGVYSALSNINIIDCIVFNNNLGANNGNVFFGGSGLNTTVRNGVVRNCSLYTTAAENNLYFGGLTTGSTDAIIEDNIIAGGTFRFLDTARGVLRNNKLYCTTADFNIADYPDNTYGSLPVAGSNVKLYPCDYPIDGSRAHVAIFNWDSANTVNVDLSPLGWTGDVRARNVQDYFTDIQTLTITAGVITVNMQAANRTVATPQGWTAPAKTFPNFGCFVLERV